MNNLFDRGLNRFARGEFAWKASGGSTVKAFLIDLAAYTPNQATHEYLSDVPAGARKGNAGGSTRADAVALTLLDPSAGVCDANDPTFTAVPAGAALAAVLLFVDAGADATSPLIGIFDIASTTPNGGDIGVQWDNGANKIFKL